MTTFLLTIALAQQQHFNHEFVYMASSAKSVSVAGTFNNWNKDADPMIRATDGKTWKLTKSLAIGNYQYKFVVNGQSWVTDPSGDSRDDGHGNVNTFLSIVPPDFSKLSKLGDGLITESALSHHAETGDLVFTSRTGQARFLARTRKNDVNTVQLRIGSESVTMKRVAGDDNYDVFSATIQLANPNNFSYSIIFSDDSNTQQINRTDVDASTFAEASVPGWPKSAVFYQIFPDRFSNGDHSNDPAGVEPWGSKPTYSNFMGGDIAGISKKLSYLTDLGISGIYFNPLFKGPSNHGYETTDYLQIDPRFGTNDEFVVLTKLLKSKGIDVVLDGVFNHSSVDFAPFKEIRDKGKSATTLDWYTIKSFPVVPKADPPYEAWAGHASLPKLNVMNPATKQYIFDVVDYWDKEAEIAGWRLDVANEVPMPFWREFRNHIKSNNPDTWIIGENWTDSLPWLKGDQWDSVMNYPLRGAILSHIAVGSTSSSQFLDELMRSYLMYSPDVSANMLNSLSTHDVPRFKSIAKEDDQLCAMGAVALFAWPGVPCIYYGDELGMTGGKDPENRLSMQWELNSSDNQTLNLYKKLIRARHSSVALQTGEPIPLFADDKQQVSAFARKAGADVAIACFNRSSATHEVELDLSGLKLASTKSLVDVVSGKTLRFSGDARLRLRIPGKSALLAISGQQGEPLGVRHDQKQLVIQR
ncbi:MAG: alpha-amylase family glycosyl hydrolase [Fimbriimonadaceae bacterium]